MKYIISIIIIIVLIIINTVFNKNNEDMNLIIQTLIRQSARWSLAAKQDENLLIAVLHANYGAGYLWALKDIATDEQIKTATGINMSDFTKKIVSIQDSVTKRLAKTCHEYSGNSDKYLAAIAGES